MKAYVINLDDRPDRMIEFNKNEFPFPVERFSAIKGETGAEGCTKSHLKLLSEQHDFPVAIFEDDCKMIQPWSFIEEAMSQLPDDWSALWLGATLDTPLKIYSPNLYRLKRGYCTHGIIYNSRELIDFTINNYYIVHCKRIIDVFYYQYVQDKFKCFITSPVAATQGCGYSNVMNRDWTSEDDNWIQSCYDKFMK